MTTLEEAREYTRQHVDEGVKCPCCTQLAKVYRRPLNSGMARSLIIMARTAGTEWCHLPSVVGSKSREEGKLRYWGLVEEELERREDGGRAGYWRVTQQGRLFVRGLIAVPKYAYVYDSRLQRLDGPMWRIQDALGSKFDYDALMRGDA